MRLKLIIIGLITVVGSLWATSPTPVHQLPNGFRYVIKSRNCIPDSRISFRLVMNIGSLQEAKGEEGVAHYIEHLAFRDTKNYPNGEVVKLLESLGGRYGVTFNAFTGYDRTVYDFSIPADHPKAIETGINIAFEWLENINFTNENILRERNIIKEEIEQSNNDFTKADTLLKGNNPKIWRAPVGTVNEVNMIKKRELERFYKRFYTPENASLIVIGSALDTQKIEHEIAKRFNAISKNKTSRILQTNLKYKSGLQTIWSEDTTTNKIRLEFVIPQLLDTTITEKQLLKYEQKRASIKLINKRLREKNCDATLSLNWYLNRTNHLSLSLAAEDSTAFAKNIVQTIAVLKGIKKSGFSENELNSTVRNSEMIEREFAEQRSSESWKEYFTDVLLFATRYSENISENRVLAKQISETSSTQWHKIANDILTTPNTILAIYSFNPKNRKASKNISISLEKWSKIEPDTTLPIEKFEENSGKVDTTIFGNRYNFSKDMIANDKLLKNSGLKLIKLKNGATLILKKTENRDGNVLVNMIFRGGLIAIPAEKYHSLESASAYLSMGGVEKLKGDNYFQTLEYLQLSTANTIENRWHGIMASGNRKNIVPLSNLIYERCFAPERCYEDFDEIKKEMQCAENESKQATNNSFLNSSDRVLRNRVDRMIGNNIAIPKRYFYGGIEQLNLDSMAKYYNETFTKSNNLTCLVVGNFDEKVATEQFVGMLNKFEKSDKEIVERKRFHHHRKDENSKTINLAQTDKFERIIFTSLWSGKSRQEGLKASLIEKISRDVLQNHILKSLRNDLGLIYSPYITLSNNGKRYFLEVNGSARLKNLATIKLKIEKIFNQLSNKEIEHSELNAIKKSFLVTKSAILNSAEPSNWREYLTNCIKNGISMEEVEKYEQIIETITTKDILNAFRNEIDRKNSKFIYINE